MGKGSKGKGGGGAAAATSASSKKSASNTKAPEAKGEVKESATKVGGGKKGGKK
ncbi:unnamed protein product [Phyllotreta striolata]|uniref:Uncharacterized protein n=1 Tax=Phyllotreta striolata TaxID=444603 RepID=A0A9N9TGH3_PHYSR|nr:unnamed protein product [Phyllotreta striolata]